MSGYEQSEVISMITSLIVLGAFGILGWLARNFLNDIRVSLRTVLDNQKTQETSIAELKKDVTSIIQRTDKYEHTLDKINDKVGEIETDLSGLNQWKVHVDGELERLSKQLDK